MKTFSAQHSADPQAAGEGGRRAIDRIQLLAQQAITTALDLVFPPVCVSCERVGSFLCHHCQSAIQSAAPRTLPEFAGICVHADFDGPISDAIHAFKYNNVRRLIEPLGTLLTAMVGTQTWPVDLVTAVPMHESRLQERGYNQAELLAAYVARQQSWPFMPDAVTRIRATPSQVNMNAQERRANVAGAFEADPRIVQGRVVLLVDDVLTTGSTLSACAEALSKAGALRIYGAALAGAIGLQNDPSAVQVGQSV